MRLIRWMAFFLFCFLFALGLLGALPVFAQSTTGELRLTVTDPSGLGVKCTVGLVSQLNEYDNTFTTDDQGKMDARRLPYGIYHLQIQAQGFAGDFRGG